MRVLELFSGIGGARAGLPAGWTVAAAIDQSPVAVAAYGHAWGEPATERHIVPMRPADFAAFQADLWWMSPPCQPYTRKGQQRDLDDPRAASLLSVLRAIREVQPAFIAFENVLGFAGSRAHAALRDALAGYTVAERALCPSELGWPNRRPRFYLVAARDGALRPWAPVQANARPLAAFLDPSPSPALYLAPELVARWESALDRVDVDGVTACFASGYGHAMVRSGSYLRDGGRLRRFSPAEVARLLGFPDAFQLLPALDDRARWSLLGNSLHVAAVREVLTALPDGAAHRSEM